jgi:3-hydroxybutyryl-CoA dehydratase
MSVVNVGASAKKTVVITNETIRKFSSVSGDINPIHLDDEYAKLTKFKRRIAPGLQVASYISALIANELPGPGSIYMEQSLKFLRPVYIDDVIEVKVTVIEVFNVNKIRLKTEVFNADDQIVLEGEALVKAP